MSFGRRLILNKRAGDMTPEEFAVELKRLNDEVLCFDDRQQHGMGGWKQKRRTRTQQGYVRASMRRTKGTKWGYTGGHI